MKTSIKLVFVLLLAQPLSLLAETLYVTDSITVGLFESSALSGEPTQRLLSGAPLQVLQKDKSVAKVKTEAGSEGWVRMTFLSAALPGVLKLEQTLEELKGLERELDKERATVAKLKMLADGVKDVGWMRGEMNKARKKAAELEKKLTSQSSENKQSGKQLSDLTTEIDYLKTENADLKMRLGAVLLLNGEGEGDSEPETTNSLASWLLPLLAAVFFFVAGAGVCYYWQGLQLKRRFGGIRVR